MDRRLLLGVMVLAVALGLAGMSLLAPTTEPLTAARTPPPPTSTAPTDAASPRTDRTAAAASRVDPGPGPIPIPIVVEGDTGTPIAAPPPREIPDVVFDLDQVYTADLTGLGAAALGRRDRILQCYGEYRQEFGEIPGRLTLRMTVSRADDGEADVLTQMAASHVGAEVFDDCMAEAMADATFEAPESGSVSMLWPVPMSGSERLPQ
jgi:hypothetical protein